MITIADRVPRCINSQCSGSFDGLYIIEDLVFYLLLVRKNSYLCFANPWRELLEGLNGSPITFPGMVKQRGAAFVPVPNRVGDTPFSLSKINDYLSGPL